MASTVREATLLQDAYGDRSQDKPWKRSAYPLKVFSYCFFMPHKPGMKKCISLSSGYRSGKACLRGELLAEVIYTYVFFLGLGMQLLITIYTTIGQMRWE